MSNFDDLLNNSPAEQDGAQLSKEDYAAKKQAEREAAFELSDNAALEVAGNGDMFRQYLDVQSTFSRYSAVNALLIMAQMPEATRLGDFGHWKGQGGYVKPGQTAISILEPHEYTKEDGSPGTGYNVKKVFDISQVDTRKVKTAAPAPTYTERQLLKALIHKAPVEIIGVESVPSFLPDDFGAFYDQKDNNIIVQKGMDFSDIFRSVAQELAFADLHTGPDTQADPHFSAYSAAYMLCKKYGVDTQGFNFSDAPAVLNDMDAQEVKGELSQIRDAADAISGRMAKQLDAVSKAAKSQDAR